MTAGQALDLLPVLIDKITSLEAAVAGMTGSSLPFWLNLPDACKLKGLAYGTVKNNPDLMPAGGWAEGMNGKVRLWRRETVLEWLPVNDLNRAEYLAKCRERRTKAAS